MAEFELDAEEPLWQRGEETLTIGGRRFDVYPLGRIAAETDHFNFQTRPVSFVVESLVVQFYDDQHDEAREVIGEALQAGTLTIGKAREAAEWIAGRREAAAKAAVRRSTGRPTLEPSRSTD